MSAVRWDLVWAATAAHLDRHRVSGFEALLTEDVVRFATIQELVIAGVAPADIMTEWRRSGVPDAVDLMITQPTLAAIEFKFPREPRETNAAWTQHLGEVLKDFYRLAAMPAEVGDRWCVQLLSRRMRRYLDGVNDRYNVRIGSVAGELTRIDPTQVAGLPTTALRMLRRWIDTLPVLEARCAAVHRVGDDLRLVVHTVQPFTSTTDVAAMT